MIGARSGTKRTGSGLRAQSDKREFAGVNGPSRPQAGSAKSSRAFARSQGCYKKKITHAVLFTPQLDLSALLSLRTDLQSPQANQVLATALKLPIRCSRN